jgi:hypothetical protein
MNTAGPTTRWERTTPRSDEELRVDVERALSAELRLGGCCIDPGRAVSLHAAWVMFPEGYSGCIEVNVEAGVVTLDGNVGSRGERRLAGLLAGRVPGCRRVVNALAVDAG